ncbi:hypothetical protein [uncultured Helicobacter sp.]|uniref:hypothetical protein n=1 Tax=uncultured Helicobacter sp. TaxID=175537 RepID=UPI00374F78EF
MRVQRSNLESSCVDSKTNTDSNPETNSKAILESKIGSQAYENSESSSTESKSEETLESSFLDSHSHEYFSDSKNLVFSQKKKGFIPSPLPLAPKKIKRRFSFSAIKGSASLFPLLAQSLRRALLPPFSNDCAPRSGRDSGCSAQDNVTGKPSVRFTS